MKPKRHYYVSHVHLQKLPYDHYFLSWRYGGRVYWAESDFIIDMDTNYLYRYFHTPTGKGKTVRAKL